MACTGELPPNTRSGQSFIHDPKVAGETEVKAQIKLRFLTEHRGPVIVIRSFQLTQKKTNMQFKALDNTLQTYDRVTGAAQALSYRCADIDHLVPSLMGVTKAILENVIFVHQEDSNWPLAEGPVLKKKFDDIFAATKYTKALEELRKLRTKQAAEVREMRLKLEHLRTHKDAAAGLRARVEEGESKEARLAEEVRRVNSEAAAAGAQAAELDARLASISGLGEEARELRAQHALMVKKNAEAEARLLVRGSWLSVPCSSPFFWHSLSRVCGSFWEWATVLISSDVGYPLLTTFLISFSPVPSNSK
jgi:DNA repair protein RAD50